MVPGRTACWIPDHTNQSASKILPISSFTSYGTLLSHFHSPRWRNEEDKPLFLWNKIIAQVIQYWKTIQFLCRLANNSFLLHLLRFHQLHTLQQPFLRELSLSLRLFIDAKDFQHSPSPINTSQEKILGRQSTLFWTAVIKLKPLECRLQLPIQAEFCKR